MNNGTAKKGNLWMFGQILVSAILTIGMRTFLKPCGPKEDGTFMNCHKAGNMIFVFACIMLAVAVVSLFVGEMLRLACLLAELVCAACAFLVPGTLISLCMMPDMRCRAIMQPGARVLSVLLFILCAVPLVLQLSRIHKSTK